MRSKSPLLSPQNQKLYTNLLTPTQKRHVSQLSTGQYKFNTPQTDFILKKREFQFSITSQVLDKQRLLQTTNNYYRPNSIQRRRPSESPSKILFKTGYEQQQEIKKLIQENQNLKAIIKKQEDQLKQFYELGNILEQNQQLQEKIEKLKQDNYLLRQDEEQVNKNIEDQ
ncbi:unnamed protein product [Paramecium pentaurelia]|uniref:Uncharacterized protein n=1 Tax=Paramecium pentaurelia TaxID=43138 RepID=A0A8S1THE6_9CILI|nr:unnamed protein product [Paramecium pentaurelia]